MEMGEKIKTLRLEKKMTLEELGNKVGVGKSTVRKWENGIIANMKRDKIANIAKALGTTPAYLMGWEDQYSIETADLHLKMTMDKEFQELYFYWEQMSDIGKRKVIDNIQDLSKIYRK